MQKLLNSTLALVALLMTVGLLQPTTMRVAASDVENDDVDPFSLGVSLDDNGTVDFGGVRIDDATKLASQMVHVAVGFHMGYDLSLEAGDSNDTGLRSKDGFSITSTAGGDELTPNSWGFRQENANSKWLGLLSGGKKQLIASRDNVDEPRSDDVPVQFGVRVSTLTMAGEYEKVVRYSVTARELETPAVRTVNASRLSMGEKHIIEFTGSKLNDATLGVDINGNGTLDSGEVCAKNDNGQNDANHLSCQLQVDDGAIIDTVKSLNILMKYRASDGKNAAQSIGKAVTYYHLPRLSGINLGRGESKSAELKIYPKVNIRAIDTAGTSAIILGTDGTVWQDGRKVLYDGAVSNEASLSARPTVAIEPRKDGIVSIAAGTTSAGTPTYFAIDRSGAIYGWGDNTNKRLLINDGDYVGLPTKANYHASTGKRPRQIAVGGDFYALIGEGSDRDDDKLGLYSWGSGVHDALGIKGYEGKESWNNNGEAPLRMTRDQIERDLKKDDYFTKIVTGNKHGLALTKNGQIVSWGTHGGGEDSGGRLAWKTKSDANQIHNITRSDDKEGDHYFTGEPVFADIAAGDDFTIILDTTGIVYTFGRNSNGQLGRSPNTDADKAIGLAPSFGKMLNGDKIIGVSAKGHTALAWSKNGQLFTWGWTYQSRLPSAPKSAGSPLRTSGDKKVKFAAAGENLYEVADGEDGNDKVYRWSSNGEEDITNQLKHPIHNARLSGVNLNHIGNIWIDYNSNGALDDNEKSSAIARIENSSTSSDIQLNTDEAPSDGVYNLCADNGAGDVNCDGVKVKIDTLKQQEITPIVETDRQSLAKEAPSGDTDDETAEVSEDSLASTRNDAGEAGAKMTANNTDASVNHSKVDEAEMADDADSNEGETKVESDTSLADPTEPTNSARGELTDDSDEELGASSSAPISDKTPQLLDDDLTSKRPDAIMLNP